MDLYIAQVACRAAPRNNLSEVGQGKMWVLSYHQITRVIVLVVSGLPLECVMGMVFLDPGAAINASTTAWKAVVRQG